MKETGILFTAPMVRAILARTKRQTRRVVKPQPTLPTTTWWPSSGTWMADGPSEATGGTRQTWGWEKCPYGQPGDRLWVRETFARIDGQTRPWIETDYRATYTHGDRLGDTLGIKKRWTPSIHMPRHASRITLEVTRVRVERLQDICEADVLAEGIQRWPLGFRVDVSGAPVHECRTFAVARDAYRWLWEEINGPGSWDANPWVWVVEFERVKAKGETP